MGGKQNLTLEVNITFRVLELNSTRPIYSISTRQPIPGVGMRVSSFPLFSSSRACNEWTQHVGNPYTIAPNKLAKTWDCILSLPLPPSQSKDMTQRKRKIRKAESPTWVKRLGEKYPLPKGLTSWQDIFINNHSRVKCVDSHTKFSEQPCLKTNSLYAHERLQPSSQTRPR